MQEPSLEKLFTEFERASAVSLLHSTGKVWSDSSKELLARATLIGNDELMREVLCEIVAIRDQMLRYFTSIIGLDRTQLRRTASSEAGYRIGQAIAALDERLRPFPVQEYQVNEQIREWRRNADSTIGTSPEMAIGETDTESPVPTLEMLIVAGKRAKDTIAQQKKVALPQPSRNERDEKVRRVLLSMLSDIKDKKKR